MAHMTLGAYPTDSYYDPGRPSWLPYWIDTLTESALKYGLYPGVTTLKDPEPIPAPPAPPVPAITASGTVIDRGAPDVVQQDWATATKAQIQAYMNKMAEEELRRQAGKKCGWTHSLADDGVTCEFPSMTVIALGAGAAIALLALLRR